MLFGAHRIINSFSNFGTNIEQIKLTQSFQSVSDGLLTSLHRKVFDESIQIMQFAVQNWTVSSSAALLTIDLYSFQDIDRWKHKC